MPKILPEGHRVIIKPDEAEEQRGSIWIPKTSLDRENQAMQTGVVVDVGPNADTYFKDASGEKRSIMAGDRVYIKKYAQYEFRIGKHADEEKYWVINDADIIGVEYEG